MYPAVCKGPDTAPVINCGNDTSQTKQDGGGQLERETRPPAHT